MPKSAGSRSMVLLRVPSKDRKPDRQPHHQGLRGFTPPFPNLHRRYCPRADLWVFFKEWHEGFVISSQELRCCMRWGLGVKLLGCTKRPPSSYNSWGPHSALPFKRGESDTKKSLLQGGISQYSVQVEKTPWLDAPRSSSDLLLGQWG